jgi:hypothetical protein
MEKETRHIFISLFVLQSRGWYGVDPPLQSDIHSLQVTWS